MLYFYFFQGKKFESRTAVAWKKNTRPPSGGRSTHTGCIYKHFLPNNESRIQNGNPDHRISFKCECMLVLCFHWEIIDTPVSWVSKDKKPYMNRSTERDLTAF